MLLSSTLFVTLYAGTFAIDTFSGGYWRKGERDGHDRHPAGLSLPTAILWQPRLGYWTPYYSDWLGAFYAPLIRLDRRFLHPTHYLSDPSFGAWFQASTAADWNPRFRAGL